MQSLSEIDEILKNTFENNTKLIKKILIIILTIKKWINNQILMLILNHYRKY